MKSIILSLLGRLPMMPTAEDEADKYLGQKVLLQQVFAVQSLTQGPLLFVNRDFFGPHRPGNDVESIHVEMVGDEPVVYELPGAPPTGRKVKSHDGGIFRREHPAPYEDESIFGHWGAWHDLENGVRWTWINLLRQRGPLTLMDLDPQEQAEAELYGPPGARWGFPDQPCPFRECTLGAGHIGAHRDVDGKELATRREMTAQELAETEYCTCGNAGMHRPDCPRYQRLTGV